MFLILNHFNHSLSGKIYLFLISSKTTLSAFQQTFTCSKLTIGTLEKDTKCVSSKL